MFAERQKPPAPSHVWIISPSDRSMGTTLTPLGSSCCFSLLLYLAAGKKCHQATLTPTPTPGSVLELSSTHRCQCVKADYSPSNTICCLICLNLPVLIQGFHLGTTSELREIMRRVALDWYRLEPSACAGGEDARRLNKRLELQQKRNRHALTKSLTVDSSGDAGERLEDDRAVSLFLIMWHSVQLCVILSHNAQTRHFVLHHDADFIWTSFVFLSIIRLAFLWWNCVCALARMCMRWWYKSVVGFYAAFCCSSVQWVIKSFITKCNCSSECAETLSWLLTTRLQMQT